MPRPLIPDRRERILDAAEELVLDEGFDAMSVSVVAARAGIGKGAVYLEFASKRDILDAMLLRGTARLEAVVAAELGEHAALSATYRAAARALLQDPLMSAAFLDDRSVLGRHVDTVTGDRYRARHVGVVGWLRTLQDTGKITSEVDTEHLALALSSATIGLLSAGTLLGPVTRRQLEGAIEVLAQMAETFERGAERCT